NAVVGWSAAAIAVAMTNAGRGKVFIPRLYASARDGLMAVPEMRQPRLSMAPARRREANDTWRAVRRAGVDAARRNAMYA
ncbi:hypothetical protein BRO04_15305, partial [Xanthomonas oryzae pv. oryzae]